MNGDIQRRLNPSDYHIHKGRAQPKLRRTVYSGLCGDADGRTDMKRTGMDFPLNNTISNIMNACGVRNGLTVTESCSLNMIQRSVFSSIKGNDRNG